MQLPNKSEYLFSIATPDDVLASISNGSLKGYSQPRFLFVGKSNVGKSSLLNILLHKELAHTSKEPGKTKYLNFFFEPKSKCLLVDAPGYGFATRSAKTSNLDWEALLETYLKTDDELRAVFILIDSRHEVSEQDRAAINYFSTRHPNVILVFSKYDLIKTQSDRSKFQNWIKSEVDGAGLSHVLFSSKTKFGFEKLVSFIKDHSAKREGI